MNTTKIVVQANTMMFDTNGQELCPSAKDAECELLYTEGTRIFVKWANTNTTMFFLHV